MSKLTNLGKALLDLDEAKTNSIVQERLKVGDDPMGIVHECNEAMAEVGYRFERGEYFISELMMSGEIFSGIMDLLKPLMGERQEEDFSSKGLIVIGTVKGDVHDIGKNIVITLLQGSGFKVMDLGVDVPAEHFIQAVNDYDTKVLGLSALLNITFQEMKNVVDQLADAGLRDKVKVIIGGAPCNEQVREFTGADYYARDAGHGLKICEEIYG